VSCELLPGMGQCLTVFGAQTPNNMVHKTPIYRREFREANG